MNTDSDYRLNAQELTREEFDIITERAPRIRLVEVNWRDPVTDEIDRAIAELDAERDDVEAGKTYGKSQPEIEAMLHAVDAINDGDVKMVGGIEASEEARKLVSLREKISEFKAKRQPKEKIRPWEYEKFGIDPADSMALEKVKVGHKLAKFRSKLADLEAFHPGFWELPPVTERGEGKSSRALALKNFLWKRYHELTAEKRQALKDAKQQRKLQDKIKIEGLPPVYEHWTPKERRTFKNRLYKQKSRKRAKAGGL